MNTTLVERVATRADGARSSEWVNDIHSRLNATPVREVLRPSTEEAIARSIQKCADEGRPICVSGSRHAMGGQQFAEAETLIDLRSLKRVHMLDRHSGVVDIDAGIEWPELIRCCAELQSGEPWPWTIRQKQTGADQFTLGGSLASNVHGRGLAMTPLSGDVESFRLINAAGESMSCSRTENRELFGLAIGGYGLFGVITRVQLRLQRRQKLRRRVRMVESEEVIAAFSARIREGCLYGDFQFSVDERSPGFLRTGIMSVYQPVAEAVPVSARRELSAKAWMELLHLGYSDRAEGFRRYTEHYLATEGQTYWSDTHQLSAYLSDYAIGLGASTIS